MGRTARRYLQLHRLIDIQLTSFAVNAPALVDFWHENFRLQVEARSGQLHLEAHGTYSFTVHTLSFDGLAQVNLRGSVAGSMNRGRWKAMTINRMV